MFPSMPQDDAWDADHSRAIPRPKRGRLPGGGGSFLPKKQTDEDLEYDEDEEPEEIPVVPVRRQLSLAIAVFGALLAGALILGAQTSAPDSRWPFAIVLLGVQLLFLLAWTMALRPPEAAVTTGVCTVVALAVDYLAVTRTTPGIMPLFLVALAGFVVAFGGQLVRGAERSRALDTWRGTVVIVLGVVAYGIPVVLTRQESGTQTLMLSVGAAGLAILVARLTDAIFPKPRIAAQVPRGATGVVLGAMVGTLATAALGGYLVLPFTPAKGAVIGLVAAVVANLVDLAVNFGEAGRTLAGDAPTFWVARHMQGPLGAFAVVTPVAYLLTHWYLT